MSTSLFTRMWLRHVLLTNNHRTIIGALLAGTLYHSFTFTKMNKLPITIGSTALSIIADTTKKSF